MNVLCHILETGKYHISITTGPAIPGHKQVREKYAAKLKRRLK